MHTHTHTHIHTQLLHNPAAPEAPLVPDIKRQPSVPSQSTCGETHGRNFTRPLKCPPPLTQRATRATQAPALSPHSTRPRWAERSLPPWLQAGQRAPPPGQRRASGPETRVLLRFCSKDARQPFLMSGQQRSRRTQPCAGRGQWAGTRLDTAQLRVCPSQAVGRQGRGPWVTEPRAPARKACHEHGLEGSLPSPLHPSLQLCVRP